MEGRREIQIKEDTKGKIVRIENQWDCYNKSYWIVLISHIKERIDGNVIYRHVTIFHGAANTWEGISLIPKNWGVYENCKFYEATEEEKQEIKELIKRRGFKYIKPLNKLIKR